jgi:hypothetical protein
LSTIFNTILLDHCSSCNLFLLLILHPDRNSQDEESERGEAEPSPRPKGE